MKKVLTSVATGVALAVIPASQALACQSPSHGNGDDKVNSHSYSISHKHDNNEDKDDRFNKPCPPKPCPPKSDEKPEPKPCPPKHDIDEDHGDRDKDGKPCPPKQTVPQQPTGSKGAGDVNGTTTVTPVQTPAAQPAAQPVVQAAAQLVTPKGAVNAGSGNTETRVNAAAIAGLTGSLASIGLGLRRLLKSAR